MNRIGAALLALLLLQGFLITKTLWPTKETSSAGVSQQLAPIDSYTVEEIHVSDLQGNKTLLRLNGDRWLLPELGNLPANAGKIQQVLTALTTEDVGWPIAHSVAARQRFRVADYHYQRKVALHAHGRTLQTVYLGTSPGFQKIHVRNANQDNIFSIKLNAFDAPVESDRWLDTRLLQIRAALSIVADGYSLQRDSGNWLTGSGAPANQGALDALLAALRGLQVTGVAPETIAANALESDLILTIEGLSGRAELALYDIDGEPYVSSSLYQPLFKLSRDDYDKLIGIDALLLSTTQ